MSEAHNLLGGGIVFLPIGSEITETHLTNGIGTIVRHKPGMAPQYVTPAPVHPQTYQRQRDLPQDALADVGLSQLSARSEKPAGLNAAVALQTYTDIETERFAIFARSYEAWCLDVARMFIDVARDIAKTHGDYAVNVPLRGGILDLSWKDVVVDGYELRVFPTSLLPQQPAARLEKLMTLFNAQVIDRATFLRELDAPDLSAEMDMETADKLNVDERLEAMLDAEDPGASGAYRMLTPYQDIAWGLRRAQQRLNKAETDGAPEDNLRLLRRFITDGEALQDRLKREAAANTNGTPPATGAPPPGPPGGPPPPAAPPPPGMPPANPAPPIAA